MEDLTAQRSLFLDHLALAAGLATGIVGLLFWCVELVAGLSLPAWYCALGLAMMTWATYAQLQQRREREEI